MFQEKLCFSGGRWVCLLFCLKCQQQSLFSCLLDSNLISKIGRIKRLLNKICVFSHQLKSVLHSLGIQQLCCAITGF